MDKWESVLKETLKLEVLVKTLPTKGNLAYEYNPFRNYRLTKDMYEYDDKLLTMDELNTNYAIYLAPGTEGKLGEEKWLKNGEEMPEQDYPIPRLKGELVDFVTDELNFDLNHPVQVLPQYSYDGSVNLILTDGVNLPRLINSRFSATGKNTYEIVDRKGNNDTNIYDLGELFDVDTSLYKRVKLIPKLELKKVTPGGSLHCGNYHFYFKLADADGNETDFVAESGLVSLFIGFNDPSSIYSGNKNENSVKLVLFLLSNIDPSYNYVYVYYTRATAEDGTNKVIEYKKIDKKYLVNNVKIANILITGSEDTNTVAASEINLDYNVVDAANCAVTAKSMLFLGNVHKPTIPYETLTDLSLRFLPYLKNTPYDLDMDQQYNISSTTKGYYDPMYIYNKVGYWDLEMYRLGIVYILSNGELSSVFNIRGRLKVSEFLPACATEFWKKCNDSTNLCTTINDGQYHHYFYTKKSKTSGGGYVATTEAVTIKSNEFDNLLVKPIEGEEGYAALYGNTYENDKGVVSFYSLDDTNVVHGFEVRVDSETISKLKALGIKGFFFVRQGRIPLTLTLGITIGVDKIGRVPTIPTKGGILSNLSSEIDGSTYVETKNLNAVNYVSEGFLSRFKFELKRKSSSLWSRIGSFVLVAAAVAAMVAGTIVSCGAGAAPAILGFFGVTSAAATAMGASLAAIIAVGMVAGAAGVVAAVTTATIATVEEIQFAISRNGASKELKGRNTQIASGFYRSELDESRLVGSEFKDRLIIKDPTKNAVEAILCPDYDVAPLVYNQYFTGAEFTIRTAKSQATLERSIDTYDSILGIGYYFENNGRHFYIPMNAYSSMGCATYCSKVLAIPDDTACLAIGTTIFRSKAGNGEEAWRYECMGTDFLGELSWNADSGSDSVESDPTYKETNSDIVRGSYGPYLGMTAYSGTFGQTVSIMIPGYSDSYIGDYVQIRMLDVSPYSAISDRIDLSDLTNYYQAHSNLTSDVSDNTNCSFVLYRGDCYICLFTHRLNRNFNDPNAPYNDVVVDAKTWKTNYKVQDSVKFEKINAGDVNAVKLGMWVTFTVRSDRNLNIRSLDSSSLEECTKMNHPKGFYPYHSMITEGSYKSSEALVYNAGFTLNLSQRINFTQPDAPFIKNWFGTRIMYSDININDGISNGFRVFQGLNYVDYTREYGEIVKMLNYNDDLFVVFEHGLALIPINERTVAAQGTGGNVYINTSKVLPETPNIISGTFGSLWADSVVLVPSITTNNGTSGASIFGVDTIAKKIWRFNGQLSIISDLKVQEFLNLNLTLTERENTPIMGIRNVKTAYNAFKHDVMFTFYDDLSGTTEKVWNLCYNILMQQFTTFYSWVPSYMENINNIPFSFDRNVSKWIAKLGISHAENSFAEGITLSLNIYNNDGSYSGTPFINFKYLTSTGSYTTKKFEISVISKYFTPNNTDFALGLIGVLNLEEQVLPEGENMQCWETFTILRDIYGYYKHFTVKLMGYITLPSDAKYNGTKIPVYGLYFKFQDLKEESETVWILADGLVNDAHHRESLNASDNNKEIYISFGQSVTERLKEEASNYFTELYYRNKQGSEYNDYDDYKITILELDSTHCTYTEGGVTKTLTAKNYFEVLFDKEWPIFHDRTGARISLKTPINKHNLVQLLNIRANIKVLIPNGLNTTTLSEWMSYLKAKEAGLETLIENTQKAQTIDAGYYESTVAVTSKWNYSLLDSSFWRHGQAGVFDNTEDILPTKWYGEQHPFEFEFLVNDNPGMLKIFQNLEIVSNKAKPESFHFEIVGESYDFSPDKVNMYFRQEARKALFLYNGVDIEYNSNFLKTNPRLLKKSAELIHSYYERQDTMEDIYDTYVGDAINGTKYEELNSYQYGYNYWSSMSPTVDYRHLSGAEIVYYPNRQEYRIWQHLPAINLDELPQDTATSIVKANCRYLEDRWRVSINPLLICYKNEYRRKTAGALCLPKNSTWPNATDSAGNKLETKLPPITLRNTSLPRIINEKGEISFPNDIGIGKASYPGSEGPDNALCNLYYWPTQSDEESPYDVTNWLDAINIYGTSFGAALNRKETDLRDKFIKIRIRYSGEELAVILFLQTIYTLSYAL